MNNQVKEDFFAKSIEDMVEIQEKQKDTFKSTKDPSVVDKSVADFY